MNKLLIIFSSLLLCVHTRSEAKLTPLSNSAIEYDANLDQLYLAQKTAKTLELRSAQQGTLLKQWNFNNPTTGVAIGTKWILVTSSFHQSYLHIIDKQSQQIVKKIEIGMGACSPLITKDEHHAFVCNQFQNTITKIDLQKLQIIATAPTIREPKQICFSKNQKELFVANFLPQGRADVEKLAAVVSVYNTNSLEKIKDITLENGSNALRGICLSPEGKYVFVSHNLGRFQVPTSQLQQGWMNTSGVSIIDATTHTFLGTVLFDEPEHGAAGIWDIKCNSNHMIVSHSGTHEISLVDYPKFIHRFEQYPNKAELAYDLRFLSGIRKRIKVKGNGPRQIAFHQDKIYLVTYFTDQLNIINLTNSEHKAIALNPNYQPTQARLGEQYFNDASYCFQQWQSCNGCHPGDARTDGMNWDLLNDGIGNPKNCKSMLHAHLTPPAMITGIRADAETAVRAGFFHIQFAQVSDEHAQAVDQYLKSLKPQPSPYLVNGKLSEKAQRGKKVFEKASCDKCHSGIYYTDLKMYKIGNTEFEQGWDTPTLIEVWRTAPYLNNGSMPTLKDLFTIDKHGLKDHPLKNNEIDDLIEYVNSL